MINLTHENFTSEVINSPIPTAVDFWATWCAPCRKFAPVFEELSREYDGRVKFCKANADENTVTAAEYGVVSIPTVIIFKNGKEIRRIVGAKSADEYEEVLDSII